jgi:hypothetical protein
MKDRMLFGLKDYMRAMMIVSVGTTALTGACLLFAYLFAL